MNEHIITPRLLADYVTELNAEEKSPATVQKYRRDCAAFAAWAEGQGICKDLVIHYKQRLIDRGYAPRSVNSMLAALNSLFAFAGWADCHTRVIRIQRPVFCREAKELSREEYVRLVQEAERRHNDRLSLILQTLCGTGIRISELPFITAEAVSAGETTVRCKGKVRTVFLPRALRHKLSAYLRRQGVTHGPVFVTRGGQPVSRTNVWREMKDLCRNARVLPDKVFPHNLRHLFARVFYQLEKDIAQLADILGHSSINTTRLYIISTGAEHRRKVERMHLIL